MPRLNEQQILKVRRVGSGSAGSTCKRLLNPHPPQSGRQRALYRRRSRETQSVLSDSSSRPSRTALRATKIQAAAAVGYGVRWSAVFIAAAAESVVASSSCSERTPRFRARSGGPCRAERTRTDDLMGRWLNATARRRTSHYRSFLWTLTSRCRRAARSTEIARFLSSFSRRADVSARGARAMGLKVRVKRLKGSARNGNVLQRLGSVCPLKRDAARCALRRPAGAPTRTPSRFVAHVGAFAISDSHRHACALGRSADSLISPFRCARNYRQWDATLSACLEPFWEPADSPRDRPRLRPLCSIDAPCCGAGKPCL